MQTQKTKQKYKTKYNEMKTIMFTANFYFFSGDSQQLKAVYLPMTGEIGM